MHRKVVMVESLPGLAVETLLLFPFAVASCSRMARVRLSMQRPYGKPRTAYPA
jgi:EamA domain-containing membrane protein RarD